MKSLYRFAVISFIAALAICVVPVGSLSQCFINCPQGDGGQTNPSGSGKRAADFTLDGVVDLADLASFAFAFPPNAPDKCSDYNCDGIVNVIDLAHLARHLGPPAHSGATPAVCSGTGKATIPPIVSVLYAQMVLEDLVDVDALALIPLQ